MRSKIKSWQDLRSGWSFRITWYEDGDDIRLKIETDDGVRNIYPENREEADMIWEDFKECNQRPKE